MGEEGKKAGEKKQVAAAAAAAAIDEAGKGGDGGKVERKKEGEKKKPDKIQNQEQENRTEDHKKKDKKESGSGEDSKDAKPPPPPEDIVLRVYMHCEGCARKVRRSLKGFSGVEDVITDWKSHKVVVKGEKADPLKVLERVQKKSPRRVELLSPIPPPPPEKPPEQAAEEPPKVEEEKKKNEEPQVITVVLKVHMNCEACSQEIKKLILRMKGVEWAEADMKSSEVSVRGVFEVPKLVEYVYKRTGKHAVIVKQDPPLQEKKVSDEKTKQVKKAGQEESKEKNTDQDQAAMEENNAKAMEFMRNDLYHYPAFYQPPYYPPDNFYFSLPPPFPPSHQYYQPPYYAAHQNPQPFTAETENQSPCFIM
ncbi:hypothetical protein SAY86_009536 [Trapa natans]|uniref:HMA domain-containing protein n=1 Tax=Trapa natans TaxID=22666 RepID=A0AAN7QRB8_TRANT|nr:hypothetical protein SAY86_009536 [Trapa natans]